VPVQVCEDVYVKKARMVPMPCSTCDSKSCSTGCTTGSCSSKGSCTSGCTTSCCESKGSCTSSCTTSCCESKGCCTSGCCCTDTCCEHESFFKKLLSHRCHGNACCDTCCDTCCDPCANGACK